MSPDKPVTTQARTPSRSRDRLANLALAADQSVMSEDCPDDETFARFIEGGLSSDERQTVFEHISKCDGCYRKWLSVSDVLDTEQEKHRHTRYRKRGLMTAAGSVCAAAVGVMLYLSIDYQPMVQTDRVDSVYSEKASAPPVSEQQVEPEGIGAAPEPKRDRLATSAADTKADFEALDSEVVQDPAVNLARKKQRAPEERAESPQAKSALMVPEPGVVAGAPGENGTERDVTASPESSLSTPQHPGELGGTAHYIEEFVSLCGDYPENRVKQSTVDTLVERGQALLRTDTVQGDERAVITEITTILEKGIARDSGAFIDTCRRAFEFGMHRGYDLEQLNF